MILKYTLLDSYQYEFLTEFSIFIPSVPDHLSPLRFRLYKRFRPKIPEKKCYYCKSVEHFLTSRCYT